MANDGFLDDYVDLLPDTISIATPSALNMYNEPTFSTPVTYKGRIVHKSVARRTVSGTDFTSPAHVIVAASTTIPLDSQVTFPDATTHQVASVDTFRDENNAIHHCTLYLAG